MVEQQIRDDVGLGEVDKMREEVDGKRGVMWAPMTRTRCYQDLDPVTLPEHKERMNERRVEGAGRWWLAGGFIRYCPVT